MNPLGFKGAFRLKESKHLAFARHETTSSRTSLMRKSGGGFEPSAFQFGTFVHFVRSAGIVIRSHV